MSFIEHNHEGVVYMTAPNISATHCFTTRYGGVSSGALSSMNLGENRGDDPANVVENYRRIKAATGVDTDRLCFTKQLHGKVVRVVTEADIRRLYTPGADEADGLVTNVPGLAIVCYVADCVPLLLHDPVNGVAAAVHCGWRSTVQDIMAVAVEKMQSLGGDPSRMQAAIGASIGACCFEVGAEVPEAVRNLLPDDHDGVIREGDGEGKYFVDLREVIARRLVQLGVPRDHIVISTECTMCSSDKYWSHRATKGDRGTQAAMIML